MLFRSNSKPFVDIANVLLKAGLNVPKIYEADLKKGFLLLSDLGDKTYFGELNYENASLLYRDAYLALIKIQKNADTRSLKLYDESLLMQELRLFPDWYLKSHKSYEMNDLEKNVISVNCIIELVANGKPVKELSEYPYYREDIEGIKTEFSDIANSDVGVRSEEHTSELQSH